VLHPRLVGLHRPVEGEEILIPTKGIREDLVALGIAVASDLLALRLRFGHQDGHLAVRL